MNFQLLDIGSSDVVNGNIGELFNAGNEKLEKALHMLKGE